MLRLASFLSTGRLASMPLVVTASTWNTFMRVRHYATPPVEPPKAASIDATTETSDSLTQVTYDVDDKGVRTGVVILSFNTPENDNTLTITMGRVFEKRIRALRRDPNIHALVLTGQGTTFSAGTDLDFLLARANDSMAQNQVAMRRLYDRFLSIRRCPFPIIAAINGPAIGSGACLTLACDMRLMSTDAYLDFNSVQLGLPPGMGGTHFLPMLTSHQVATRLFLTGERIGADEARRLGLVLSCHPGSQLIEQAIVMGRKIGRGWKGAVKNVVQTMRVQGDMYGQGLATRLDMEAEQQ
eukprot:Ihof_evm2s650 gene=Ihof_evmTU2s650